MGSVVSIGDVLTVEGFVRGRRACWAPNLAAEFEQPYMRRLRQRLVDEERAGRAILPQPSRVFEALDETTPDEVKVVVIGQDPYPAPGQAHGLAFSVANGERPQSLIKIFSEIDRDMDEHLLQGASRRMVVSDGTCLTPWARQGVLLLNTVLTVREGLPSAHVGWGWESFTDRIIGILKEREHVVFMLWGKEAQRKGICIDRGRHLVLCAGHPRIGIKDSRHFSRANSYLETHGKEPIDWLDVCRRPSFEDELPTLSTADAVDEARWDRRFAASQHLLTQLADEAAHERKRGRIEKLAFRF